MDLGWLVMGAAAMSRTLERVEMSFISFHHARVCALSPRGIRKLCNLGNGVSQGITEVVRGKIPPCH